MSKKLEEHFISDSSRNKFSRIKGILKKESFLIPIIVFTVFYIFILLQNWVNITLILIPLISFSQYLFFNILNELNGQICIEELNFEYKPFGNEKKISDRLFFIMLSEMIIIYVLGSESYRYPQLIEDYFYLYIIPLVLLFIFSLYYSFYDVGKNAKIIMKLENRDDAEMAKNETDFKETVEIFSQSLRFADIKKISNFLNYAFILLLFGWILFSILDIFEIITSLEILLPGSNLTEGTPLGISFFIYVALILVPLLFAFIIFMVHKTLLKENRDDLCAEYSKLTEKQKLIFKKIIEDQSYLRISNDDE